MISFIFEIFLKLSGYWPSNAIIVRSATILVTGVLKNAPIISGSSGARKMLIQRTGVQKVFIEFSRFSLKCVE